MQMINKIGECFDKIYFKKYRNLKIRSNSEVFELKNVHLSHQKSQP